MPDKFPKNLRRIRKNRKLSQQQLAAKIGISNQVISLYEKGKHTPNMVTLEWLCIALKVNASELLGF